MKLRTGKRLDAYHDGKTSPSRLSIAEVIDVVKITDLSKKYLRMWKKSIVEDFDEALMGGLVHYIPGPQRFWDWNCDEFIFAFSQLAGQVELRGIVGPLGVADKFAVSTRKHLNWKAYTREL